MKHKADEINKNLEILITEQRKLKDKIINHLNSSKGYAVIGTSIIDMTVDTNAVCGVMKIIEKNETKQKELLQQLIDLKI